MAEQAEIVTQDPLETLTDELNAYYDEHGLEHMCALDMFHDLAWGEIGRNGMTERQRIEHMKYLMDFAERWDEAEDAAVAANIPKDSPQAD